MSSTTLSYAIDSPWITSITAGALKAGSKAVDHLTLKIHYRSMTAAVCTPQSSCGV